MTEASSPRALAGDPGPVSSKDRIQALDVMRGVALCGILLMNIVGFGLPFQAYEDPTVAGGADGLNLTAWWMNTLFFEGTMRTLFSMLFGAGVILITQRAEERGTGIGGADIFVRRNAWLVVFGMIHAYVLLWDGDILYTYGIVGLFLFAFRNLPARTLVILGVAVLGVQTLQNFSAMQGHRSAYEAYEQAQAAGEEDSPAIDGWQGILEQKKPSAEAIEEEIAGHRRGYFGVMAHIGPVSHYMETTFFYDMFFLDAMAAMLLGMALFKSGVLTAERGNGYYGAMVAIGYAIGLAVNYYEGRTIVDGEFSIFAFDRAMLTYHVGRIAMAAGHIGLVMLFAKSGALGFLRRAIAAVGRMALTNYIMHTLICVVFFSGFGFGMYGRLERHELYYVVVSIWVFQLIVSPLWLAKYRFGPLEWLWRSLTYWKRQPMLIARVS